MSSGNQFSNSIDEVDELQANEDLSNVGNLPRAPISARQQQRINDEQSDSMRNLLIVEYAGRPTLFIIQSIVALLCAACLLILSMAVVIVLPLMYSDPDQSYPISINLHNCWAYGLWLPFLVVPWAVLMLKAAKTGWAKYTSRRQFGIQIACDVICSILLLEGSTLLIMYFTLFLRLCREQSTNNDDSLSRDNRNWFV
uniref:Uncharacterized protein n=1 Tax=Macrostomum lignano TaxID=282301 RepID=A0A1I8GZL9_9PLAT